MAGKRDFSSFAYFLAVWAQSAPSEVRSPVATLAGDAGLPSHHPWGGHLQSDGWLRGRYDLGCPDTCCRVTGWPPPGSPCTQRKVLGVR